LTTRSFFRSWPIVAWLIIGVLAVVAGVLQLPVWVPVLVLVVGIVSQIVARNRDLRTAHISAAKDRFERLYGPWAQVARAVIARSAEAGYLDRLMRHLDGGMGEAIRQ